MQNRLAVMALLAGLSAAKPCVCRAQLSLVSYGCLSVTDTGQGHIIFTLVPAGGETATFRVVSSSGFPFQRKWEANIAGGRAVVAWDGKDEQGKDAPAGPYAVIARVTSGEVTEMTAKYFYLQGVPGESVHIAAGFPTDLLTLTRPDRNPIEQGREFPIVCATSRDAQLRGFITDLTGRTIRSVDTGNPSASLDSGSRLLLVQAIDAGGNSLPVGRYRLVVAARASRQRETRSLEFDVVAGSAPLGSSGGTTAAAAVVPVGSAPSTQGSATSGGAATTDSQHTNNGVRDHGAGDGRDGAGQGRGRGTDGGRN